MCYKSFAKTAFAGSWKLFNKTLHKKWFSHQKGTYPHNKNTRTRGDICSNPKITAVELRQLTKRKIFFPPTPLIFIKLREKLLNMSITGDYLDTTEH